MIEDVIQDGELEGLTDFNIKEFSGDFFSELFNKDDDDDDKKKKNISGSSRSPSPSSCVEDSQWIKEIESMLFQDDEENSQAPATTVTVLEDDDFFADLELPQPLQNSSLPKEEIRVSVDDEEFFSNILVDDGDEMVFPNIATTTDHSSPALETGNSSEAEEHRQKKRRSASEEEEDNDDPISKKLKRQIRNRDAAVRSRERKKEYVKDLELKSKYLEGECIRLQRLLQYCSAENHALHLQLQEKASRTKQESAVLLLESLLLGSLLWFLGMLSLLSPLEMHLQLPVNVLESVDSSHPKAVDLVALGRAKNESIGLGTLRLFFKRKRCKATRSRMRALNYDGAVAVAAC